MKYVNLGGTGLRVSRICLGMMSYGTNRAPVGPRRGRGGADRAAAAVRAAINFFDTADVYSAGERGDHRAAARQVVPPRRGRGRHQGLLPNGPARTTAACPASTSWRPSTPRWGAWAWTTWTCTRSTAGTTAPRSRRPWRRCTTWSGPGRPATSAPAACSPGSSPRPSTPPTGTAGPGSCPCRTTTTWSTARKSGR